MTAKLKEVLDLLEEIAPARLAEPWDNSGLQVGSYSQEIRKIFLALDPTLNALREAKKASAQLLLTHHPLIFRPLSRLVIDSYPQNVIFEAAKNKISVVAVHTNLDVAKGGINDILAELLGLRHVEVLREVDGEDDTGLGRIGNLTKSTPLSVVVNNVKGMLGVESVKVVGQGDLPILRIAVVGGSGGDLVGLASEKGADLLLTGDVGHHHALEAESMGMALIDGGHFHTEKVAFRDFARSLKEAITIKGWELEVAVDEDESDPMQGC